MRTLLAPLVAVFVLSIAGTAAAQKKKSNVVELEDMTITGRVQKPVAAVAGLALLAAFMTVMHETTWPRDTNQLTTVPFNTIGTALFNRWAVPFEIASGVLLVALVGSIVIAMQEEGER